MPQLPREIEVERLRNIIKGFGWEIQKEEVIGPDLALTVKKRLFVPEEIPTEEAAS